MSEMVAKWTSYIYFWPGVVVTIILILNVVSGDNKNPPPMGQGKNVL